MDKADETAAWRELEAAVGTALWRYAETVTGVRRDAAGQITEGAVRRRARAAPGAAVGDPPDPPGAQRR